MTKLAARSSHKCALAGGTVACWGWNGHGGVGDGTTIDRASPVVVPGLNDIVDVATGNISTLAIRADGAIFRWGGDLTGQYRTLSPVRAIGW